MTEKDIIDRLARLETKVELQFCELEKSIPLARQMLKDERVEFEKTLEHRLQGMNEFQKRIDRAEGTFATKTEVGVLSKIVWAGLGVVGTLQFALRYLIK